MSQSHATMRRFPDAPPLSPDNPGLLTPAQLGLLPGALPGRGGPDVPRPFGAPRGASVRGTLPANAAGPAVASLVNGLPFGGLGVGGSPAVAALPVEPPPVVAPPPHVAPPPLVSTLGTEANPADEADVARPVRATIGLGEGPLAVPSSAAPVPPPPVVAVPPSVSEALLSPIGATAAPGPTPAMGTAAAPSVTADLEPAIPAAVPPAAAPVAPPPRVEALGGSEVAPATGGAPSAAADPLDSPWLKAPPPAPVVPPPSVMEPAPVVVAAPIQHPPPRGRAWIVVTLVVLLVAAGGVALLLLRSQGPARSDEPLEMQPPKTSPRAGGDEDGEPSDDGAPEEPPKPVGTGLPPVGPDPRPLPGQVGQPARPKPTATSAPAAPPKPTSPKFDPSTI